MLKYITTLKWSFKLPIQRSLSSITSLLFVTSVQKYNLISNKHVIWNRCQATTAVLLDCLCNNLLFEQFYKRVFGLGNKTYSHYEVAICVDDRLEELGGRRIFEVNRINNDEKIEDDFDNWKSRGFFSIEHCAKEGLIRLFCSLQQPDVQPERINTNDPNRLPIKRNQYPAFDAKNPFLATVTAKRELHKGGERSCMHIELDIDGSNMKYDAGDHVAIFPVNDKDLVERLGKLCEANLDSVYSLINTDTNGTKTQVFSLQTTYRNALTHYLEITAIPSNQILEKLSEFCSDERDKEFLRKVASTTHEGKEKYQRWIQDSCRNIVHILEDIKSCKPSVDHVCELLPRLQPRFYSISSSSKLYPTKIHITAVLVQYKTLTGRINKGVATSFLKEKLHSSDQVKVPVFINKSKFRLPIKAETPIVMVALGTGLAPFRSFIQERQFLRHEGKIVGDTILYFGCRKKDEDFIYKEELEDFVEKGTLTLKMAFSRDQKEKIYVTHLLVKDADLLWKVIGQNKGHFYICGADKNMAEDIRNILVKLISTKGNMSEADAAQYLRQMEAQNRYSDAWGC